ncbi:hypothetical protein MHYP_G00336610 [Metynnis hypsauchen]
MGSSDLWVFLPLEVIIAVACCLGNALVIWAVWICGALRQPTFCFIVSLAVADFLVGSVAIPIAVLVEIGMNTSFYGCLFMCCVMIMLEVASVAFLLAIAVDRFLRVRIPLTFYGHNIEVPSVAIDMGLLLTHANSAVNPIVYAFRIPKIKEACSSTMWVFLPLEVIIGITCCLGNVLVMGSVDMWSSQTAHVLLHCVPHCG